GAGLELDGADEGGQPDRGAVAVGLVEAQVDGPIELAVAGRGARIGGRALEAGGGCGLLDGRRRGGGAGEAGGGQKRTKHRPSVAPPAGFGRVGSGQGREKGERSFWRG